MSYKEYKRDFEELSRFMRTAVVAGFIAGLVTSIIVAIVSDSAGASVVAGVIAGALASPTAGFFVKTIRKKAFEDYVVLALTGILMGFLSSIVFFTIAIWFFGLVYPAITGR